MSATRRSVARPPRRRRVRRWGVVESLVVACGAAVGALILGLTLHSSASFSRELGLVDRAGEMKVDLVLSHLWLEEYVGGDRSIDVNKQILDNIYAARMLCRDLAAASKAQPGAGGELAGVTDELCPQLDEYKALTLTRLSQPRDSAIGSERDQAYDKAFTKALKLADDELRAIEEALEEGQRLERWRGIGAALTAVVVAVGIAFIMGRHRRRLAAHVQQLGELAAIVSASPDAILSTSPEGVVMSWNQGAELLFGWSAEEIVGRNASVLVPEGCRDQEDSLWTRVRGGEPVRTETERRRKDGSVVPVALTASPIVEGELVTGMASIQQDITERRTKDAALAAAREKAHEASRLKSEFLATMSHEIRTPMNGVIGLTSLLLDTSLDEVQRQYAEGVQGAGEALLAVINDILDFSKLEAGKVELEAVEFEPTRLAEEIAALLAPAAHAKGLELIAFALPEVPEVLIGDSGRIRQILLNLASNAVKFTATGEVVIKVRSVPQQAGPDLVRFEVVDTGIGVTSANAERLFDSFSQADASTTRRFGGSGLGLAISRKLTEAMGGEIGVDSELGTGSTFWFQVPLPVGEPMADHPKAPHPLVDDTPVLVVDDNATNRLVMRSQLTGWRLRPTMVEDAAHALVLLREAAAAGQPYRVAVLDMCMPGMDGLQLARLISSDEGLNRTRIIMLTSSMAIEPGELRAAGVHEWLTKPVRSSEFYDRLVRLMGTGTAPTTTSRDRQIRPPSPAGARGRVLVVEDNPVNQMVAEAMLSRLGYQVDMADNGVEALEAIEAADYAAVLMDCHMPVMDGFTATEEVRRRHGDSLRIPIIAMTAGAMVEDRERCLAAGMDDYISKPVTSAAIDRALSRWAVQNGSPAGN